MTDDLDGRVVLLTGASGGIGSVTAKLLLERGAYVIAHYGKNRSGAELACDSAESGQVLFLEADLEEPASAHGLWEAALAWRGRVDVIVANAATAPSLPFEDADEAWIAGWESMLRTNVIAPATLIRCALPHFVERGDGVVIVLSSWAAQRGSALVPHSAYASSKAAIQSFAQSIARNFTASGVLTYVVAPGIVGTPMSAISAASRGGIEALNRQLPLGEVVPPLEVADIIATLASGRFRHLAGATLDINGAANIR